MFHPMVTLTANFSPFEPAKEGAETEILNNDTGSTQTGHCDYYLARARA